MNQDKMLLPNDVRKLLNIDNKEIVELCKKTSINPKKNEKGQIYFSVDEVRKLKNAKSSIVAEMNENTRPYTVRNTNGIAYSDARNQCKRSLNKVAVKHTENQ